MDRKGVEVEGTHVLEQLIDKEILHGEEEKLERADVQLLEGHLHEGAGWGQRVTAGLDGDGGQARSGQEDT